MLTTLIGCNKNEDLTPSYASDGTEVFSSVAVFNAIPNSTGITMFMGQGNQQKAIITSSDKLVYGGYVGYKNWYTGSFELTIENQVGNTKESARKNIFLPKGKFHSLFLYRNTEVQTVLSEDNVIRPNEGKAKVRVAHFSDNLSTVNLYDGVDKVALIQNTKALSVSEYVEVDISKLHDFNIQTTDGKLKLTMKGEEKLVNRGLYTLLLKGSTDVTGGNGNKEVMMLIKQ